MKYIAVFDRVKVKQLPEKKDLLAYYPSIKDENSYWRNGWNACIEKTLGEEND